MTDHLPSTASAQSRWEHDLRIPSISYQFVLLVPPGSSLIAARFKKKNLSLVQKIWTAPQRVSEAEETGRDTGTHTLSNSIPKWNSANVSYRCHM